jgi:hypothetical protein
VRCACHPIAHFDALLSGSEAIAKLDNGAREVGPDTCTGAGKVGGHFPVARVQGDRGDTYEDLIVQELGDCARLRELEDPWS